MNVELEQVVKGLSVPPAEERIWPATDIEAWLVWPDLRFIHDRMWLAWSQDVKAHPHGVLPEAVGQGYPVFSKPITNLWGMGMGARPIDWFSDADYAPGHFWMPFLHGKHISLDVVLERGRPVWAYEVECHKAEMGSFYRFDGHPLTDLSESLTQWLEHYLGAHTGVVNAEMLEAPNRTPYAELDDRILIDVHLRPNIDFLHFYGSPWVQAVSTLMQDGVWYPPADAQPATVYPVRAAKEYGHTYDMDMGRIRALEAQSIMLCARPHTSLVYEPNDERTYRLALIGDTDPEVARTGAVAIAQELMWPVAGRASLRRGADFPGEGT